MNTSARTVVIILVAAMILMMRSTNVDPVTCQLLGLLLRGNHGCVCSIIKTVMTEGQPAPCGSGLTHEVCKPIAGLRLGRGLSAL